MAGKMHINPSVSCWVDPEKHPPAKLRVRSPWSFDGDAIRALNHDPACAGCSRAFRARGIREKRIAPHPSVKTRDTLVWKLRIWWRKMNARVGA